MWIFPLILNKCLKLCVLFVVAVIERLFRVQVSTYIDLIQTMMPSFHPLRITLHPKQRVTRLLEHRYARANERIPCYATANTIKTVEEQEKENETVENVDLPTLRLKCDQLEEEKRELKIQRDDAVRRLSEVMSSKLRDNNPNIVDLSDELRPTKLAEMSSELYDNEWTEAFTVIEEKLRQIDGGIDEKGIIQILLDILMGVIKRRYGYGLNVKKSQLKLVTGHLTDLPFLEEDRALTSLLEIHVVYTVGKTTSEREWKTLMTSVIGSTESASKEDIKYLKDLRKKYALGRLEEAQKTCLEKLRQSLQIEPSVFSEERVLTYIKGCVKLCWLAQCQDPPVVFVCPGFKSVGDNPVDGLEVSLNFGPERTTPSASLADNQNDSLAVSLNFTAPGSFNDNQNDSLQDQDDTLDVSPEREIASAPLRDNQIDNIPVQDTLDVSPERFDDSGSIEMDEWCSDESPTANHFGATGRDIDQMKIGENDAKTRIEFDKGLNREFARNVPNEGERVPTEHGTRPENVDDDRAVFDKTLYREYTKSGGYIEYVVWPVMLLHEGGPILGKGVAQGCD